MNWRVVALVAIALSAAIVCGFWLLDWQRLLNDQTQIDQMVLSKLQDLDNIKAETGTLPSLRKRYAAQQARLRPKNHGHELSTAAPAQMDAPFRASLARLLAANRLVLRRCTVVADHSKADLLVPDAAPLWSRFELRFKDYQATLTGRPDALLDFTRAVAAGRLGWVATVRSVAVGPSGLTAVLRVYPWPPDRVGSP